MGQALNWTANFDSETCISCGVVFWMPSSLRINLKRSHNTFYCPNGHAQLYSTKSDVEKAREAETVQRKRAARLQEELWKAEKSLKRLKTRAKNGVCPCCNRTFKQLAAHMKRKHPELRG